MFRYVGGPYRLHLEGTVTEELGWAQYRGPVIPGPVSEDEMTHGDPNPPRLTDATDYDKDYGCRSCGCLYRDHTDFIHIEAPDDVNEYRVPLGTIIAYCVHDHCLNNDNDHCDDGCDCPGRCDGLNLGVGEKE